MDTKINQNKPNSLIIEYFIFFIIIVALCITSYFIFLNERSIKLFELSNSIRMLFPSISEIVTNSKLIFNGYLGGYARTLYGYIIFSLLAISFISVGKLLFRLIFKDKTKQDQDLVFITNLEVTSISYIIGSLFFSLFWYVIGFSSLLSYYTATIILLIAVVFSIYSLIKSSTTNSSINNYVKTFINSWKINFSFIEKLMLVILFLLLFLHSTYSVLPPYQHDALFSHAALSNYYIQEGKILFNKHHYYSYFTQNTEVLIMWPLLLKSEVAAKLLIWGFFAAFVMLIAGYLKRITSNFVSLVTCLIFVSIPVVSHSSFAIKNDISVGLFIFAHYYAFMNSINLRNKSIRLSNNWMLLSGILGGGAIGHKLIGVPVIAITCFILITFELYNYFRNKDYKFSIKWLLIGILVTSLPWFIRTWIYTGNPIYPFFSNLFGSHIGDNWNRVVEENFGKISHDFTVLMDYLRALVIGGKYEDKNPIWGPTILLGLLSVLMFKRQHSNGLKLIILSAILSTIALHNQVLGETRFHLGMLLLITLIPFAIIFNSLLTTKSHKIIKAGTLIVIVVTISICNVWALIKLPLVTMISGYTPGNVKLIGNYADNMYWMGHLVNSRVGKNDKILFAGMPYTYAFKRKMYWNSQDNKELLFDLAEKSNNSLDLFKNIRNLDIKHVLLDNSFYSKAKLAIKRNNLKVNDYNKITELINNHLMIRQISPDSQVLWYSFIEDTPNKISYTNIDSQQFPVMFFKEAKKRYSAEEKNIAKKMLNLIIKSPAATNNKVDAYVFLATIYADEGKNDLVEKELLEAINKHPKHPLPYLKLGFYYSILKKYDKSLFYYNDGIVRDEQNSFAHFEISKVYSYLNKHDLAIKHLETSINLDSNQFDAYINLADSYKALDNPTKAIFNYEKAIKLKPNSVEPYKQIGLIFFKQNKLDKSFHIFSKLVENNRRDYVSYNILGTIFIKHNNHNAAKQYFIKATQLNNNFVEAYMNLGNVQMTLNEKDSAKQSFLKVIQLNPNDFEAYNNLGILLVLEKKYNNAEQVFKKAIQLNPNFTDAKNNLTRLNTLIGK